MAKFGGTSLGNAHRIKESARIAQNQRVVIIVVSAMANITDQLGELSQTASSGNRQKCEDILKKISIVHLEAVKELNIEHCALKAIKSLLNALSGLAREMCLLKDCSPKAQAKLQSFGERMSSELFLWAYNNDDNLGLTKKAVLVDACKAVKTDSSYLKAKVNFESTQKAVAKEFVFTPSTVYVTQGFIGANEKGETTLLGRGGSDYSAAVLAEAFDAEVLQIWTDVRGIKTMDPKICPLAKDIGEISFQEASELAVFGAKILHPATLIPVRRKGINTYIGSSFAPKKQGTWIVKKQATSPPLVRAMAKKDDRCLLILSTPRMLYAYGFLYKIFKVFSDFAVSVDSITTSEISVAVTIEKNNVSPSLFKSLEEFAKVDVEESLSLISLIGNNINYTPGLAAKIFSSLEDVNIRMICQGASRHNFCFLVSSEMGDQAVKRLHQKFIEEKP